MSGSVPVQMADCLRELGPAALPAGLQASLRWNRPVRGWLTGLEIAPAASRRLQQPLVECALQRRGSASGVGKRSA